MIRELPPVAEVALSSMVLVIVGTIYLAANVANDASLVVPIVVDVIAAVLLLTAGFIVGSIDHFARRTFHVVARWALLGYLVIAGMIELVFIRDHTPGAQLATLSAGLVIFVLSVTLILAFSVARYQPPD